MLNKKYKDTLFRIIFHEKTALLSLYNALNGTHYTNEDGLFFTTIEGVLYLGYQNDLSFLIEDTLFLYEHQSTRNPNMPLRGVFYFSKLYQAYVSKNEYDIYGSAVVPLPVPKYVVFYNGTDKTPDRWIIKLSDAFIDKEKHTDWALECTVEYININIGHSEELLNACRILWEYSYFIKLVRDNLEKGYTLEKAAKDAMDTCIAQGILKEILERNRDIMVDLLREYDLDAHIKSEKKLSYDEGLATGANSKFKEIITSMLAKGKSVEEIADLLDEDLDTLLALAEKINL